MRRLFRFVFPRRWAVAPLCLGLASSASLQAAPANDNFLSATELSGLSGSVSDDSTGATSEPGEPSHAGQAPMNSLWYKWVAPADGEVSVDTMGSVDLLGQPMDTVLAVYVGSQLSQLTQVAANDELYPAVANNFIGQLNNSATMWIPPFNGPSGLRFTAKAGTTYYLAVDSFATGEVALSWAYYSAGVFRFATEDFSLGLPTFQCIEGEGGLESTYYTFGVPGVQISVTRVGGAAGRMLVDYLTVDTPTNSLPMNDTNAFALRDYLPMQGTLLFDNFEMTKSFVIPVGNRPGAYPCRTFNVVLTNARPAEAESPLVSAPRIDPLLGEAIVRILDTDIDPRWASNFQKVTNIVDDVEVPTDVFTDTTNLVFNFTRKVYRYPRDVNEFWDDMDIMVFRGGTNQAGATLHYRINNVAGSNLDVNEERNNSFPLQAGSDYASVGPSPIRSVAKDYVLAQGTITFGQNDNTVKHIHHVFTNDTLVKFNKDLHVFLYMMVDDRPKLVGQCNETTLVMLADNDYPPAGSVDQLHNPDHLDGMRFRQPIYGDNLTDPGADGPVYDLKVLPGDQTLIAGQFSSFNGITRNGIARMNFDGSLDWTFDPGTGMGDPYNDFVAAIGLNASGNYIIGGDFTLFGDFPAGRVARLNSSGVVDTAFATKLGQGADNTVWSLAVQADGGVILGGAFTRVDGVARPYLARLNADGSVDQTFVPAAPDGELRAVALDRAGRIVIAGDFLHVGGVARSRIARLNTDGSLDASFDPGFGADASIYTLAVLSDNRVFVGGAFTRVNLISRGRIALLKSSGALDTSFDPGTGADAVVYSITPRNDGTVYVGGLFDSFNGTHRLGFTRLYADGTVDTTFMDTAYNQFAGLHRLYFNKQSIGDPHPYVRAAQVQSDGNVMIGGAFSRVGGGQADFIQRADPDYPAALNFTIQELKGREGIRNRANVARLIGGMTPGPGNLGLALTNYTINKSQAYLSVGLSRTKGTLGYAAANFAVQPGLAQSGVDYAYGANAPTYLTSWRLGLNSSEPASSTRSRMDGLLGNNVLPTDVLGTTWYGYTPALAYVTLLPNGNTGNRDTTLSLENPANYDLFYLGGANIPLGVALGRSSASMVLIDDSRRTNVIGFASAVFATNEFAPAAIISVTRTNGTTGSASVKFATVAGGTGVPGVNYQSTNGTLTFGPGVTNLSFTVPTLDDFISIPGGVTVQLRLSAVSGGILNTVTNAVLTIIDNDFAPGYVTLGAAQYATNLSAEAVIVRVQRDGASLGTLSVQCGTVDGTALSGVQYQGLTNTFVWASGDSTPRYLTVPLINSGQVGPNTTFGIFLTNAVVNLTNSPLVLGGAPTAATVSLTNDNYYGALQFSAANYLVKENGGVATLTVLRKGGVAQSLSVNYATQDGTAVSSGTRPNYVAASGVLNFSPGEISKTIDILLRDDGATNGPPENFFFSVGLSGITPPGAAYGSPTNAVVNIVDASTYNVPAGSVDTTFDPGAGFDGDIHGLALQSNGKIIAAGAFKTFAGVSVRSVARLNANASLDPTFLVGQSGANGPANAVVAQSDGRVLVGGAFTSVNGLARNRIARLQADGSLDTSFTPGAGADNTVYAVAETFQGGDRRVLVGGSFVSFNLAARPGLVRLNNDGLLDANFSPLAVNGTVYAIAVYPANVPNAGKILIGGDFTLINGVACGRLARLLPDGALDPTFAPAGGASDTVRALAIQADGRIVAGGAFTTMNGLAQNRVARLNADGSLDAGFNTNGGADDTVTAIVLQGDNRILLAGQFLRANGVSRSRITRLLADGSADPNINFGSGADNIIHAVALQPDGNLVLGGGFTQFDGVVRQKIARLYGGSIAGAGRFEFTAGDFAAGEKSTNALVTIRRRGGTSGDISLVFQTADGTGANAAHAGVNYQPVTQTLHFPAGETFQTVLVPVFDDLQITPDLAANLSLHDVQPPAGLGNQPTATLTILNENCAISFASSDYRVNEDVFGGFAEIGLRRQGSVRSWSTVEFLTTTNGTALAYTNYIPTNQVVTFQPGQTNAILRLGIVPTPGVAQDDVVVALLLTNANHALLYSPFEAALTIVDTDIAPGNFLLSQTNLAVNEADGYAFLTVVRTNGRAGSVSVSFATVPGEGTDAALPGVKYVGTNGILNFQPGETRKTIAVPLINNTTVEMPKVFSVVLSNPQGGGRILEPGRASVTILDDDVGVTFASPVFVAGEASGSASVTVLRIGTNSYTSVGFATTNGTALAGTNYEATAGTLVFAPGEYLKTFSVPVLRDPRVTGDLSFSVRLLDLSPGAQLGENPTALVVLLDADPGLAFTNANFYTSKSATNVVISVLRSNANTGLVQVNYLTSDGTAKAGVDYSPRSGLLTFSNGVAMQSFTVPIIDNRQSQGDRTFNVSLFNPTLPAQLLVPSTASITITDDISGLKFSAPMYSVNENGVAANLTVLRTGFTNSTVSVGYSTADGTGKAGVNYLAASGVLVFTNGVTSRSFAVTVIDNGVVDGDKTVLLNLSNAVGQAVLQSPSAATLNIIESDGSLIVPAGTALVSENGTQNNMIDPGETVRVLFGLRATAGTNTGNLIATLLPSAVISNPSGPQSYGSLAVQGPPASREFTFTANATNGQLVQAVFRLTDGDAPTNQAVFNFVVGNTTAVFSNTAPIVINDATNATPYPSVISVASVPGSVAKATVTFTNLNHSWPADIDALLVSPSGQSSLLMAKAGGSFNASKVTLTFDDDAAAALPAAAVLVSGTNRPTSYAGSTPPFPAPAPSGPYSANLRSFNGVNPNGQWSLYIIDDTPNNKGVISNGWLLSLTTATPLLGDADLALSMDAAPATVIVQSNVTYALTLRNYGPASASNIVVSDVIPPGASYVSGSVSGGTLGQQAGVVTWNLPSLARDGSATMTLVLRSTAIGSLTNLATVAAASNDPNSSNNNAAQVVEVAPPSADLAVGILAQPNQVLLFQDGLQRVASANVTYLTTVTNLGPGTAPGVGITNLLPAGARLVSASPGYSLQGGAVVFPSVGALGRGASASVSVTAQLTEPGQPTAIATCGSEAEDPLKLNNTASAKVLVEPVELEARPAGGYVILSWTANAAGFGLQSAASLQPPVQWTPVTSPAPVVSGGRKSVTLPLGSGGYYRLGVSP